MVDGDDDNDDVVAADVDAAIAVDSVASVAGFCSPNHPLLSILDASRWRRPRTR